MQSVVVSSTTDHLPAEQRSTKSKGKEKERSDAIEFDGTTVLCRVCGDKASGFHYGVHSCEGCKGFFRRSIQQKIQYRPCTKNQQCSILRINRNRCQYCRLKKCIAVGMSRDAVRFGRVPKREKAKILAAMQSVNARSQERALSAELEDEPRLIATIIKAHEQTCDYTQEKVGPLLQRAHADPVYTQCPPQLACPLNPNPHPLQNGNQRILEDFSERFSPAIRGVVEFAKRIPGFSLLSQDDQVTLLKAGVFEVLLVRLACMFDSHSNTMLCLNGQVLKRESVHNSSNARFLMDSMFDFAERLNMLRLRDAELGLFCAVVIITADRPGLRNTELVEKMQSKMMQALQNVVSQSHPELPGIFQELMKKIPDLRTLNTLHSEKLLAFKMEPRNNTGAGGSGMGSMVPATNVTTTISNCISAPMPGSWPELGLSQIQTHRSPSASNDDSKSSWEERDLIRSPDQRSTSAGSDWSLTEGKEPGSEGYSSPRSIETVPFSLDDSGAKNSTTGDNESICSGEVAQITELHMHPSHLAPPKRHRDLSQSEGGASSGDEGSVAESLSRCPFKLRKLESPSGDSGIESGKDISSNGTHSTGTSMCGSPRSLVDEKVKDMDVCYSEPTDSLNKAKTSDSSNSIVVSDPTDDMPVLKRALQAPPLINTNLLMDEAYKPHKKFRALRKETEVPNSENNNSASVAPTASPIQLSLASTHSTLVRTLEQGPRMTKQQLKRTDIIHNIIMRSENQMHGDGSQEQCSSIPTTLYGSPAISNTPPMNMMTTGGGNSVYNTSSTFIAPGHPHSHNSNHHGQPMHQHPQHHQHPSSTGASKNMVVCAPSYYIPQPNINLAAATPYSATWPFVAPTSGTGVPSGPTAATATTAVIAQAMQIRPSATYMPSGQPATIAVQLQPNVGLQPSQLSPQHLQQHPSTHRLTTVSLQGPHSTTPSPQPPSSLSAAGTPASSPSPQLPRMYYDPRSSTPTTLPSAGPPATASTVVTFSPNSLPLQQGNNYVAFSNKQPQMASKPASPMGEQQLVEIQVDISENQPLNLSKKMASPPPTTSHESSTLSTDTTTVLLQLQQQSHHQQQQQKVKLERV